MERTKRLGSTAYHEAGHAVIGRVLGLSCGDATAEPDHDSAGHAITHDQWVTWRDWEERGKWRDLSSVVLARVISFMAGVESENELLGRNEGGDGDDRFQVRLMASELDIPNGNWECYEMRIRAQTRRLVRRHRLRIERVAQALLERGTLEADEIDAIIGLGGCNHRR